MNVMVFSDSHSSLEFMVSCIEKYKPDIVLHLGDYITDGDVLCAAYPEIRFHQVPGNCDVYRIPAGTPMMKTLEMGGAKILITHGHIFHVKSSTRQLLRYARECGVDAVLYGHTHRAECERESDGLWVMNPGSCASFENQSAGWIEIKNGKIWDMYILKE